MRIFLTTTLLATVIVSCASFLRAKAPPMHIEPDAGVVCEPCDSTLAAVMVERDRCEKKLEQAEQKEPETVTKVRVVKPAPIVCPPAFPKLLPVNTTKCEGDHLCMDSEAQSTYLKNEIAIRTWLEEAKQCPGR